MVFTRIDLGARQGSATLALVWMKLANLGKVLDGVGKVVENLQDDSKV